MEARRRTDPDARFPAVLNFPQKSPVIVIPLG